MEEFEELNMMAFLDGYDALPEPPPRMAPPQLRAKPLRSSSSEDDDCTSDTDGLLVLREAEQLLDSLAATAYVDADSQSGSAPSSATSQASVAAAQATEEPAGAPARRGKTRNLSRERLKSELAFLRRRVGELEEELRVLRPGSTLTGGGGAASLVAVDRKKAILPVWQRIAERQLESRSKSEAENARLKDLLEGQIKLAKALEQMLRKRPNVSVFSVDGSSPGKRPRLQLDDESVFEMLLDGLEPAYRSLDAVFMANGLYDTCDESIRHAVVKSRRDARGPGGAAAAAGGGSAATGDDVYLECVDVFVIPFDLHVSAQAAWRSVTRRYLKENHATCQHFGLPEDTIAAKFHVKSARHGAGGRLDAKLVMRRYTENERMVLVWRTMSKGENQLSGMYTDETGWCVLKKIPASSAAGAAAGAPPAIGTVMQSCVHVVPKRSGAVVHESDAAPDVGVLTKIVIDAYEDDVISINKTMENLLLEDALSGASSGAADKKPSRAVSYGPRKP
ncbi:hypothetical protein PybrP1_011897 [[Pythium] brassicae (nom. inval.)]|nr:hypothetical protein PybrP1_011897 [[Pythium] brassicae (nom. inval.)]